MQTIGSPAYENVDHQMPPEAKWLHISRFSRPQNFDEEVVLDEGEGDEMRELALNRDGSAGDGKQATTESRTCDALEAWRQTQTRVCALFIFLSSAV